MEVSCLRITRDDTNLPILWNADVYGHNGAHIRLCLNQDEMEILQCGIQDMLESGVSEFTMEVS